MGVFGVVEQGGYAEFEEGLLQAVDVDARV